jgi:DNA-binding FadR family transcriptional regulator
MDREDQDHLEAIRYDFQFHRKLVDIVGNEAMSNVMEVIHEYVMAGMVHTTPKPRNRTNSRSLHTAILNAVRAGDADAAEKAMRHHMGMVEKALRAAAEQRRQRVPGE